MAVVDVGFEALECGCRQVEGFFVGDDAGQDGTLIVVEVLRIALGIFLGDVGDGFPDVCE